MVGITLDDSFVGNTDDFEVSLLLDGVPWAGIDTVAFEFTPPRESVLAPFERAGVVVDDLGGVWHYVSVPTDFTVPGWWSLRVKATDGAVIKTFPVELSFYVNG